MKAFYFSLAAAGLLASCTAEHIINAVPLVETGPAEYLQSNSATIGLNVFNDANSPVTENGIVLSTTLPEPTIQDIKAVVADDEGVYWGTINNLEPSSTYYYRAYATNSNGTGYGYTETFTTLPAACTHTQENHVTKGSQEIDITNSQQHFINTSVYLYGNVNYYTSVVNNMVITLQFWEPNATPPTTGVYTTVDQYDNSVDVMDKDVKVYVSSTGQNSQGVMPVKGQYVFLENNNGVIRFSFCDLQLKDGNVLDGTFTYNN